MEKRSLSGLEKFVGLESKLNVSYNYIETLASIYALLQAGFENYIGVFMSFGTSSQAGAVKDYIKDYIDSFHWYYWLILIPILLLIICSSLSSEMRTSNISILLSLSLLFSI